MRRFTLNSRQRRSLKQLASKIAGDPESIKKALGKLKGKQKTEYLELNLKGR